MLLGTIIKRLEDEADAGAAVEALGDIVLLAEVRAMSVLHDESPGQYTSGAARRFAALASSEDWLALITAIERSDDPAHTALGKMVRWSLVQDAKVQMGAPEADIGPSLVHSCACGGDGSCQPHP